MRAQTNALPAGGTHETVETMFNEHSGVVYRIARRITGRPQDAEDVLQGVFLRLLEKAGAGQGMPENPSPYLQRCAVNASLDVIRRRRRQADLPGAEGGACDPASEQRFSASGGQESALELTRLQDALRRALVDLSPREAEVFTLRCFEELSNGEIAEALEVTPNSVNVTLHSARRKIKARLEAFRPEVTS